MCCEYIEKYDMDGCCQCRYIEVKFCEPFFEENREVFGSEDVEKEKPPHYKELRPNYGHSPKNELRFGNFVKYVRRRKEERKRNHKKSPKE
jgi:hypothetical protein